MLIARNKTGLRIFTLFTGIIFLNMSFFLAEVCLLDFQDKQMIENVANLVLNGGLEEERDSHTPGGDAPIKIFSAAGNLQLHHSSLFLIASKMYQVWIENYLHADHSEKFSPPPDFISAA